MEVVIPTSSMDFINPTSPKRFADYYFSAPTSPSRISGVFRDCDELGRQESSESSAIREEEGDSFAFDFSEELERSSLPADELFDGGKIRPLKPPTRLQLGQKVNPYTAPNSPPLSPNPGRSYGMKTILGALSPRRKKDSDRPEMAADKKTEQQRGRERNTELPSANSGRRATRSLSPFRVSEFPWEEDQEEEEEKNRNDIKQSSLNPKASLSSSSSSSSSSSKSSKKWRLRDFLLFRSASEGRARDKDPFLKFSALYKKREDIKNSSFRSTASSGSVSRSRRLPTVSPHELHYTVNRAMSEDLKKKTFLPYKQGILGLLHFHK